MNSIQFDCIAVFACIRWTGIQALAQTLHVVRFEFMKADAGGKRSCSHGTHAAELWLNHTRVVTDPKGAGADGVADSQRLCRTAPAAATYPEWDAPPSPYLVFACIAVFA